MRSRTPRSSTRSAAGRCWPTSSTPGPTHAARRRAVTPADRRLLARDRGRARGLRRRAEFALQDVPRGTGDAVRAALAAVPDDATRSSSCRGDVPLVTGADLEAILEARAGRRRGDRARERLRGRPGRARPGRAAASSGRVERIVEAKDATRRGARRPTRSTPGLYAFDAAWLRRRIGSLAPSAATGELYLTDLVRLAREDGRIVAAVGFEDDGRFDGINDRGQLAAGRVGLRVRLNEAHMRAGVTMRDPSTVYIDWDVELGAGRHARAERRPARRDARSARERHRARAARSSTRRSASGRRVWASVVESSTVEDEATVGPYSHLRPGSDVGARRRDRQLRRAQEHAPRRGLEAAPHELPRRRGGRRAASNIGAGTITANYDGRRKHRTTIGDGAFLGVDTMLVAPVEIGEGARTGAGAVVTRDVPARQARGRRAGPHPRAARTADRPPTTTGRRAEPAPVRRPMTAHPPARRDPHHRPPDPPRGLLRRGRDRARVGPPEPRSSSSSRRATPGARRVRRLLDEPGPVPRVVPARA